MCVYKEYKPWDIEPAFYKFIRHKLLYPEIPQGYASIIIVLVIFSGVQLIFLGVIGEYLGRLFIANNKHPQFFITKIFE